MNKYPAWLNVLVLVVLLTGILLALPIILYQLWAFVAAGLYPHEKKYVHLYLPLSLSLFLAGAVHHLSPHCR